MLGQNAFAVKILYGEASVLVDHIGSRIALLGVGGRAWVEIKILISKLLKLKDVGVSVKQNFTLA